MPKITEYTEQTAPSEDAFVVISLNGVTNKVALKNSAPLAFAGALNMAESDFLGGNNSGQLAPFIHSAIAVGTIAQIASIANHPGIWQITSAAGANSGSSFGLVGNSAVLIGGGEVADCVARFPTTAALVARMGFYDENTLTANPTDGAWMNISGTTLTGKTASNGSVSTTASSYTMVANTWYRLLVTINAGATIVTFALYDSSGALLWSDTLAVNIPTAVGRETGFGISAIKTTVTGAIICDVDWLAYSSSSAQVR